MGQKFKNKKAKWMQEMEKECKNENSKWMQDETGALFSKDKTELLFFPGERQGDYIIPDSVKTIRSDAFSHSNLATVTIPNSVTKIESYAFYDCTRLTSVVIPNSVTVIGNGSFSGCSNLTTITISDSVTEIDAEVFFECYKLTNIIRTNTLIKFEKASYYECPALEEIRERGNAKRNN